MRELERRIGAVCRKVALRRAEGDESPAEITKRTVADMLGASRLVDAVLSERMGRPGVALGLSWAPAGGGVVFVEARRMHGRGALTLTGHLSDVMQESARAPLSWVRASAARYGIDPGFYENTDVHLHVPEGAVPKDGPSAGVAMAAALVSELTGRTVRSDLAMTGEITLSGNVLPVERHQGEAAACEAHGRCRWSRRGTRRRPASDCPATAAPGRRRQESGSGLEVAAIQADRRRSGRRDNKDERQPGARCPCRTCSRTNAPCPDRRPRRVRRRSDPPPTAGTGVRPRRTASSVAPAR